MRCHHDSCGSRSFSHERPGRTRVRDAAPGGSRLIRQVADRHVPHRLSTREGTTLFRRTKPSPRPHQPRRQGGRQGSAHADPQGGRGRRPGPREGAAHAQGAGRRPARGTRRESSQRCARRCGPATRSTCRPATGGRCAASSATSSTAASRFIELMHPAADRVDGARLLRQQHAASSSATRSCSAELAGDRRRHRAAPVPAAPRARAPGSPTSRPRAPRYYAACAPCR